MAEDRIREGAPDDLRVRDADLGDDEGGGVPDIRGRPGEITFAYQFRRKIVALGALWVLFGIFPGLVAYWNTAWGWREKEEITVLFGACALAWVTLGVLACLKHVWAVYLGLVFSYLTAAIVGVVVLLGGTNAIDGCLCSSVVVLSVLQAHRVIGLARKARTAGIPLDRKPE